MKIKTLITLLKKYDPENEIFISCDGLDLDIDFLHTYDDSSVVTINADAEVDTEDFED